MWIEVFSPHTGRTVRVRDKDVGRTVRDEEGHIFYVIANEDGDGHYASLTRKGGPDQQAKYVEMIAKQEHARDVGSQASAQQIHDATGTRRSTGAGKWLVVLILIAIAVIAGLVATGKITLSSSPSSDPPKVDAPSPTAPGNAN